MEWTAAVDAYCERTDPSFWSEPANALTNLAFFAAALYGLRLWRQGGGRDGWLLALAGVAALVGTGSFLFHTVATRWAGLADVIPIAIFITLGFGLVLHRLVGLRGWMAAVGTVAFMGASPTIGGWLEPLLGSSAGYGPVLAALWLIGAGLTLRKVAGGGFVLAAGGVFALSLSLRMADLPVCEAFPLGTHLGWHLLNGLVLALVMRAVARPDRA